MTKQNLVLLSYWKSGKVTFQLLDSIVRYCISRRNTHLLRMRRMLYPLFRNVPLLCTLHNSIHLLIRQDHSSLFVLSSMETESISLMSFLQAFDHTVWKSRGKGKPCRIDQRPAFWRQDFMPRDNGRFLGLWIRP